MNNQKVNRMTFGKAMIPVIFLLLALVSTLKFFGGDPHMPILASAVVAGIVAVAAGQPWKELEKGMIETIRMSMQAILIVGIIGMIIGTWILAGVVPTMIFYGLKIISPKIFLLATCLICSIVSLATGSSWTVAGTVGIALIGMGQGLGIPAPMVAGAIISGAYFGDKMSPLSDTTNLAPAMAGTTLFEHIRHMVFTTGPSYVIALIMYGILGIKYGSKALDVASINSILDAINTQFSISPLLLIPPILVIVMVVMKVPAIPGLIGGTVLGGLFAFVFQGAGMTQIIESAHYGYHAETGVKAIDSLLSRGGLDSMMWTLSLVLIAMCFGGIMEKSGMLEAIAAKILTYANSTGSLILATVLTCTAAILVTGEQYLAMVIGGRMYKDMYAERGLHPKNLSRTLEDSGTLVSPLVPWSTCGAFMFTTLGVHPLAFAPFAFLNWINPLVAIFYGYTGITIAKISKDKTDTQRA